MNEGMTEKQRAFVKSIRSDLNEQELCQMTKREASSMIEQYYQSCPATDKQKRFLTWHGWEKKALKSLTKYEAIKAIQAIKVEQNEQEYDPGEVPF